MLLRPLGLAVLALALGCATTPQPAPVVAARPADVATIDGLMAAFYDVVNVEPDGPRQWDRDRTLYVPWIHFVSIHQGKDGPEVTTWTHPEFIAATEPLLKAGFQERELKRRVYRYGNLAHVESSYETRVGKENPKVSRGVNFLELFFDGTRWWVASAVWQGESPASPIPAELLDK
jgi:hypothetical protein